LLSGLVEMCSFAVAIEQHDHIRGAIDKGNSMWGHGGELRRLSGLNKNMTLAQGEADVPFENEEPVSIPDATHAIRTRFPPRHIAEKR